MLTARALLYAMLLPSGADAAIALADSYGPGVSAFVRKMNTLTRKLGMTATHFTNFDGLLSSDVSTPGNLLRLGKAAMSQRAFRNVVKRKWYTLRAWPHRHHYFWRNTNLLLKRYPGVIGIKTGWTPDAASACCSRRLAPQEETLIGVVLDSSATNSGFTFVDAARLLNWGFGLHVPIPPPTPPPADTKQRPSASYSRGMTAPAAPSLPVAAGPGPQVLIVEDDVGIATQLVRGLVRGGYRVEHVTTGQEALARGQPDVVLLDLELPDGDGVNVCRKLRQRTDIAIIVITAYGEESDRVNALDAGADDYLVKPFGLAELQARIRAVLRRVRPGGEVIRHGPLIVDLRTQKVTGRRAGGRADALRSSTSSSAWPPTRAG